MNDELSYLWERLPLVAELQTAYWLGLAMGWWLYGRRR